MSLTNVRRLKGAFVFFIPFGETVDSVTVSATAWPDNDPTTNWTNYAFGCIENVKPLREYDTEVFLCPDPAGGYDEDEEQRLKRFGWIMQTSKYNEVITQLEYALATVPVIDTAQSPAAERDSFVEGVVLIQARGSAGSDYHVEQWHAKLRLATVPDWANATSRPIIQFQLVRNDLNTFVQKS